MLSAGNKAIILSVFMLSVVAPLKQQHFFSCKILKQFFKLFTEFTFFTAIKLDKPAIKDLNPNGLMAAA